MLKERSFKPIERGTPRTSPSSTRALMRPHLKSLPLQIHTKKYGRPSNEYIMKDTSFTCSSNKKPIVMLSYVKMSMFDYGMQISGVFW
jgi:hypothetical protein